MWQIIAVKMSTEIQFLKNSLIELQI